MKYFTCAALAFAGLVQISSGLTPADMNPEKTAILTGIFLIAAAFTHFVAGAVKE